MAFTEPPFLAKTITAVPSPRVQFSNKEVLEELDCALEWLKSFNVRVKPTRIAQYRSSIGLLVEAYENGQLETLNSPENALRVVNKMQAQLLTENKITGLEYKVDGTYELKKAEELVLLKEELEVLKNG